MSNRSLLASVLGTARRAPGVLGLAGILAAASSGCTGDGIDLGSPHIVPIGGDAGNGDGSVSCAAPTEGCACDPGTASLDCYLDPIVSGDGITCRAGTRYCRDGAWTACESVVDYELGGEGSALLTGPTLCNLCDPRCFGYVDRPGPGDLTGGNSGNVSYDTTGGGISLTPGMPMTVVPTLTDTDGDGVPDAFDMCVGAGALMASDGSCYGDTFFYHMLPYGGAAVIDPLPISIQIRTADIYFLMDTTGSMGGELARLQADLTTGFFHPTDASCGNGVVGAIRCAIPDAWFGVGFFDDYPVGSYGGAGDLVFRNIRDITPTLSVVQTGISSLGIHWGNDGPESNTQALWAVASGGGLGPHLTARTGCPAGRWGHPCFRDGTIPVIIHVTDAPFHNGPAGAYPYAFTWGSGAAAVSGNENFGNAYAVGTVGAWSLYTGTTAGMTNDLGSPGCGSTTSPDAVFAFTVGGAVPQTVTFSTATSGFDTVITLYSRPAMTTMAPTGNEAFASAHVMASGVNPQRFTGSTTGMANNANDGRCGSSGAPDAFYRFTLPAGATINIDTAGSGYDTMLALWQDVAGTPTYVTCNDDAAGLGVQSRIISTLTAGTYYIGVDGYGASNGAFILNFTTSLAGTYLACNDDAPAVLTSELVQTLAPGDYYAVVEGYGAASGTYQLGIGTTPAAGTGPTSPVTWDQTVAALNARDVRVITLQTCGSWTDGYCLQGESHAVSLANATGSVDGTGTPYVFRGAANGAGLSSAIVNAVVNLANYTRMDITARAVGDVMGFTQLPITAVSWGPGSCMSISGGTAFIGCTPGTSVNFNVSFQNTTVMPTMVLQTFDFFIEVVGDGTVVLERVPVRIVVPPVAVMYPASGFYVRDYDSTARCAINERPIWGNLRWDVPSLPAGTGVRFELRTADSAAALPTATPMATVTVPAAGTGTSDVTTTLASAGALTRLYHLRVNAVLTSSPDRLFAPVLTQVEVSYTCIPDE